MTALISRLKPCGTRFLPKTLPEDSAPADALAGLIAQLPDRVAAGFYDSILRTITLPENADGTEILDRDAWYNSLFLANCKSRIAKYRDFHVSYFTDDIAKKIEVVLKIVTYIRDFTDLYDSSKKLDDRIQMFLSTDRFKKHTIDLDEIRRLIVTYKNRLQSWQPEDSWEEKTPEMFSHRATENYREFEENVRDVSREDLKKALSPSAKELTTYNITDHVFASLDQLLQNVDKLLLSFCEKCVSDARTFWRQANPTETEAPDHIARTNEEHEAEEALSAKMNQYTVNELPGFSAELQLRQELDLLGRKIRRYGTYIKKITVFTFAFALAFALAAIGGYYFGVQYTVFIKENTWYVFGGYLLLFLVLFGFTAFFVRHHFRKRINQCLGDSMEMVEIFLANYISRAKEFETNINAAIDYYCRVDADHKQRKLRAEHNALDECVQWHQMKIRKILTNLKFFDGLVGNAEPYEEANVPPLNPYEDDAAHSKFYQMQPFFKHISDEE